ncbi:hypothetical protein B0H13DRAFT_1876677 [Mycena leptocephala]|nr:hypothetical protein B0H13DRAFT_1876677 [Mycena leptocephala]
MPSSSELTAYKLSKIGNSLMLEAHLPNQLQTTRLAPNNATSVTIRHYKLLQLGQNPRSDLQKFVSATKFWDELPCIFKLPSWPELNAMKRAAMGEEEDDEDEDEDDDE